MKEYFWNNLWALDRALNALFGGSSKEFMSTRIYNNRINNQLAWALYMVLNTLDPEHCERAAIRDYDKDHSKKI